MLTYITKHIYMYKIYDRIITADDDIIKISSLEKCLLKM